MTSPLTLFGVSFSGGSAELRLKVLENLRNYLSPRPCIFRWFIFSIICCLDSGVTEAINCKGRKSNSPSVPRAEETLSSLMNFSPLALTSSNGP